MRPLSDVEVARNHRVVCHQTPSEPHLVLGRDKNFTFDHVFDQEASQEQVYANCVHDLTKGLVEAVCDVVVCGCALSAAPHSPRCTV